VGQHSGITATKVIKNAKGPANIFSTQETNANGITLQMIHGLCN